MDAQVILCQECFRSVNGTVDTLDWLSKALDMEAWFVPSRRKLRLLNDRWIDCFSGLGILTSLPVMDQTVIDLPSNAADGGRKAQLVKIELPGNQRLLIANIHLTHLPDENLRRHQLQTVLDHLQDSDAHFRLIGGDWNAEVNSPVLKELTAFAADCYMLAQGDEPRCSLLACHKKNLPVCVDHFYTLPLGAAAGGSGYPSFIRAGVVLDQADADGGLYPSDHFGIRVTLTY